MLVLSDTDLILKLAEFELLDEAIAVLDAKRKDVRVLPELDYVLSGQRIHDTVTRSAIQRTMAWTRGIPKITKADISDLAVLQGATLKVGTRTLRINRGEAVLFAATGSLSDYIVATGDKNSLRVLASWPPCAPICARMEKRVVCLELIVRRLIGKFGYNAVQGKVSPRCSCDDCMQQAFANGKPTHPKADCLRWLDAFLTALRGETGKLLAE